MNHDGVLAFGGCDKNMPGCLMAMARLNVPSIFVYGGSILPGIGADGEDIDIVSIFEAVGQFQAGKLDDEGRAQRSSARPAPAPARAAACTPPTPCPAPSRRWACRCPTTPATPPCPPPRSARRSWPARRSSSLIEQDIQPRDIITRKSLENAYTFVLALGGSTNAVLHLMAIAREAEVEWTLADFDRLGDKVPHLADLKPGGQYVMYDLHKVGGTPAVLRALLDAGFLHGDCITVTGKTLAENLKDVPSIYSPQAGRHPAARQADARRRGTSSSCTATWRRRGRWRRWRA